MKSVSIFFCLLEIHIWRKDNLQIMKVKEFESFNFLCLPIFLLSSKEWSNYFIEHYQQDAFCKGEENEGLTFPKEGRAKNQQGRVAFQFFQASRLQTETIIRS